MEQETHETEATAPSLLLAKLRLEPIQALRCTDEVFEPRPELVIVSRGRMTILNDPFDYST
jgi:hypothetical protein